MDGGVQCRDIEGFEEDLGRGVPVRSWIERWLCKKDWVLLSRKSSISQALAAIPGLCAKAYSVGSVPLHSKSSILPDIQTAISSPYRPSL